jgi:hypothetical protein
LNRISYLLVFSVLILVLSGCYAITTQPAATPAKTIDEVATGVVKILTAAVATTVSAPAPAGTKPANFAVVYEKSGNLWLWTEITRVQLSNSGIDHRPKFCADKKWIVFERGSELWVVDFAGQKPRRIFAEAGSKPLQYDFAPFSHLVYFISGKTDGKPNYDLLLADPETGMVKNLLAVGNAGKFTFTPDGRNMALVEPGQIAVVQADGSGYKPVLSFQPVKSTAGDYLPQIVWMKNGTGFKTVIPGQAGKPARFLYIMTSGGPPALLAEFHPTALDLAHATIAPDGSKVLYAKDKGSNLEVHVIDVSTADKLYFSHPIKKMGLLGWASDSNGILFWLDDYRRTWISFGDHQSPLGDGVDAENVYWINSENYVFMNRSELRVIVSGKPSVLIDQDVTGNFDVSMSD